MGALWSGAVDALDEAAAPREGERFVVWRVLEAVVEVVVCRVIRLIFRPMWLEFHSPPKRGYCTMSELRERMIQDLRLAGLSEKTAKEYVRAVRQLAAYYMIRPDRISERQVEEYLLYVRDELGIARGTFAPLLAGIKFFYVNTLGYDWPLLTKKKFAGHGRSVCPTFGAMPIVAA